MRAFDRAKSVWASRRTAALRDNPRVFFVIAGFILLFDVVLLFTGKEPSYCVINGVHVCSNWVPSVSMARSAVIFLVFFVASGVAYWGYSIQDESHNLLQRFDDWLR